MARCPKLEYQSGGLFGSGDYICAITGAVIDPTKVKHLCDADNGCQYDQCPIYRDR